ncbi:MAG: hypothetical protein ACYDD4_10805, partial [Acidimicrobiales bacterium]
MSLVGSALTDAVVAALEVVSHGVASAAVWLLGEVGHVMTATTEVNLDGAWFTSHERVMATIAATLVLPMLGCRVITAVAKQDLGGLARTFFVHLPMALLLAAVAAQLVQLALA